MSKPIELLGIYLHLAVECERRLRMLERDKLFVMVGIISTQLDLLSVAAYARRRILEHNPGHMVRRWPDFRTALADPDFCHFARQVQRRHPLEKAEGLLQQQRDDCPGHAARTIRQERPGF